MPVIDAVVPPEWNRAAIARHAQDLTKAVRDVLEVNADKIQIFYETGPRLSVSVRHLAPAAPDLAQRLRLAMRREGIGGTDIKTSAYAPGMTAKGGVLRDGVSWNHADASPGEAAPSGNSGGVA